MNKPEVWMISMSDCEISQYYRKICQPTWEEKGFKVNHFEAVTPKDLNQFKDHLKFGKKRPTLSGSRPYEIDFSPTEKAVWYSHFIAWMNCIHLNRPIIVVEHDAFLEKKLEPEIFDEKTQFISFGHKKDPTIDLKQAMICGAYYITPDLAKEVKESLEEYLVKENIVANVDGYLHRFIDKKAKLSGHKYDPYHHNKSPVYQCMQDASFQFIDEKIGTTIKHLTRQEEL